MITASNLLTPCVCYAKGCVIPSLLDIVAAVLLLCVEAQRSEVQHRVARCQAGSELEQKVLNTPKTVHLLTF